MWFVFIKLEFEFDHQWNVKSQQAATSFLFLSLKHLSVLAVSIVYFVRL